MASKPDNPSIEDMKAALEAAGYRFRIEPRHGMSGVTTPDGWHIKHDSELPPYFIQHAYAHMRERQELAAARELYNDVWNLDVNTPPDLYNARVAKRVLKWAVQYNITDESDET